MTKSEQRAALEAQMAAFAAKGGTVRKVREGEGMGLSNAQWYKASRDQEVSRVVEDYSLAEGIAEREAELGGAFGVEGVNDFRIGLRKHGAKAMLGWA